MKKLLIIPLLLVFARCLTTSGVNLPHTSRSQDSWHQFNVESEMRQQTYIQQQQLQLLQQQKANQQFKPIMNESLYRKYSNPPQSYNNSGDWLVLPP